MLMCKPHWAMVPHPQQAAVWKHYRPGQCDDKSPSAAWHEAADMAITLVAIQEGKRTNQEGLIWCFGPRDLKLENVDADSRRIEKVLRDSGARVLIHGGARGADTIAADIARNFLKIPVFAFPADWKRRPKAGPERNIILADIIERHSHVNASAIALIRGEARSTRGTIHSAGLCEERGISLGFIHILSLAQRQAITNLALLSSRMHSWPEADDLRPLVLSNAEKHRRAEEELDGPWGGQNED